MANSLGIDPKKFKHLRSDDKSTTLQHKDGHTLTIAHNVLSPKMQAQLKALAPMAKDSQTGTQAQEAQNQNPKLAMGGNVDKKANPEEVVNASRPDMGWGAIIHKSNGGIIDSIKDAFKGYDTQKIDEKRESTKPEDIKKANSIYPASTQPQNQKDYKEYAEGPQDGPISQDDGAPTDQKMSYADQSKNGNSPIPGVNININSGAPQSQMPQQAAPQPVEPQKPMSAKDEIAAITKGNGTIGELTEKSLDPQAKGAQTLPQAIGMAKPGSVYDQPDQTQQASMAPQPAPETPVVNPAQDVQEAAQGQKEADLQSAVAVPDIKKTPPEQFQDHKQVEIKDMTKKAQDWQNDLQNGHIEPKTYADLFAKKDTLGKIGTIFGMLLSGAGSGLAHQENAVFKMMDQQIQNDLEAQKTSKANAHNFLQLGLQHELNQAQIKQINADSAQKTYALTKIRMNSSALHTLQLKVAAMPPGSPQRAQAEQTLAMLNSSVQNDNYNLMDRAASATAFQKMVLGTSTQPGAAQEAPASQIRKRQLTGAMNQEQAREALKESGAVENHVHLNKNALDSFDTVAKLATLGSKMSSPIQSSKRIDAEWNPMMDKLTKDQEGRVTPITVDMMSSLKPSMLDDKGTLALKRQKLQAILNSGFATPTLDSFNIKVDKGEQNQSTGSDMVRVVNSNGVSGAIPRAKLEEALKKGYKEIK